MPVPLAVSVVARVVLYGAVAAAVTAAVGWMINEIRKDDHKQHRRRLLEPNEEERVRESHEGR